MLYISGDIFKLTTNNVIEQTDIDERVHIHIKIVANT
jgi:hypothetical protein